MNNNPPYQTKRKRAILHFLDLLKQDSESDMNIDDTQDEPNSHTQKHCKFIIYTTQQYMIKMI